MRVALVSYYFPEYTIALANALAALGTHTLLVLPRQSCEPFKQAIAPEVDRYLFRGRRLRDPLSVLEAWRIVHTLGAWRADVVHLHQGHLWFNLVGLPLLKRKRLVTSVHDVASHRGDRYASRTPQWVWDIAAWRAAHVIVHAQALKTQMAQRHRILPSRIHVVPLGEVSIYGYPALANGSDSHDILFFGRIWPYKGLQYLIQAEPLITREIADARIVIAGEGERFATYEQMMIHPDRFVVHNRFIPAEEVAGLFQQAAVVVLPYTEASQSGVIPLAYAFSKPVIATRVGGIPEIVDEGETGFVVPPRDVPKLADAVIALLKNDTLRAQMSLRARQKAMTDLSWDEIAHQVLRVYEAALVSSR